MGRQGGKRRIQPVRRRRSLLRILGAVLGLVLVAGVVVDLAAGGPVSGLFDTASSSTHDGIQDGLHDRAHDGAANNGAREGVADNGAAAHGGAQAATKVVPGVELQRHVPTAKELDKKFAKRGLERVGPGATKETSFMVASFNVLGAQHTSTKHSAHPRWASGSSRMGRAVGMLRDHDISVVGFQEFEVPQYRAFLAITGGGWGVYPGDSLGSQPTDDSIAWDKSDWTLVQAATLNVPYYGPDIPMPHVLLRNTHTGRLVWFANYHNASNDNGPAQGKRDEAVRREAALVKQLAADGTPVIETGDYNDRQRAACPMMSLGGVHASDGATSSGGCQVPMKPYPTVDWVFGTSAVSFSGHIADWSTKSREISDHEMIRTRATIAPRTDDKACLTRKVDGTTLHWCPKAG